METTADPGNRFTHQCSSCDNSSARCWCLDCNEALCDVCVSAHRRVTLTRSHRILNQPAAGCVSTPPTKFCRIHPSEPLKLFCFTCKQVTCRDCQLMTHMNHSYQFVSEALSNLKKQLDDLVQPIRAQRATARQSLLDMETRLQQVSESQSNLKEELQQSYFIITQHLKRRMEELLKEIKKVCELERETIQRKMTKLKQMQQNQQLVTETAEKAQNASDLLTLLAYTAESHVDDIVDDLMEPLSPPESPVTLQIVSCSACGSANGSIICWSCGRGYHRDCHVPPVGPDIWSEWTCSLCQDLSDPSDPYSSDRPRRPQSPCLSLLDQRRCESLLLHLKVEGCQRLSELGVWPQLKEMSERLTLHRPPAYPSAAELLSDIWSLFNDASQDDDALNELQESFQSREMEIFSSELHPSALTPPSGEGEDPAVRRPLGPLRAEVEEEDLKGSEVTPKKQEVITSESELKKTRKRLRDFLDLMGTSGPKRTKTRSHV